MKRMPMAENLSFSRLIQGFWRLADWSMSVTERLYFIEQCLDLGITTMDHADIYGDYTCERLFGEALSSQAHLRSKMEIITKTGIRLVSNRRPENRIKYYDTSKAHIIQSVNQSLTNLHTDYIDVLLIHRPDPLINPEEVAEAFSQLKKDGKVRHFGVSNFTPSQFQLLNSYLDEQLITNQIEISVNHLAAFKDGSLDQCMEKRIPPLAWSPLAGGNIFHSEDSRSVRLRSNLGEIAKELGVSTIDQVMYAWLLNHPASIIPIIGSGKISRVELAANSINLPLSRQQWFEIWESSEGKEVD